MKIRRLVAACFLLNTLLLTSCKAESTNQPATRKEVDEKKNKTSTQKKSSNDSDGLSTDTDDLPFHGSCFSEKEIDGVFVTYSCTEVFQEPDSGIKSYFEKECKSSGKYRIKWQSSKRCSEENTVGACRRPDVESTSYSISYYIEEEDEETNKKMAAQVKKGCPSPAIYIEPTSDKL